LSPSPSHPHMLFLFFFPMTPPPPIYTLFPYTTLFRSLIFQPVWTPKMPGRQLGKDPILNHAEVQNHHKPIHRVIQDRILPELATDRKSTRLNSSHVKISYAVFCLKKKKKKRNKK